MPDEPSHIPDQNPDTLEGLPAYRRHFWKATLTVAFFIMAYAALLAAGIWSDRGKGKIEGPTAQSGADIEKH
jgi:hypothetical protein